MSREQAFEERLVKKIKKLKKKDRALFLALKNKMNEIVSSDDPNHYKNLRKPLQHLKRVHVKGSFVLTFKYSQDENLITFYDFDHHDNIYKHK